MVKNGQVCIAPDYCLVLRSHLGEFIELATQYVEQTAPRYSRSSDCAGIISERHLDRLVALLEEAAMRDCEVVALESGAQLDRTTRQMPMSLVIDPPDDLDLMREEICGSILPVTTYTSIDEAIGYVNDHEHPLELYVFAKDPDVANDVLNRTISGGACVNTCAIQGVLPALGFGGVGLSGNRRYRGVEGFREFSNARGVVVRGEGDAIAAFFPRTKGWRRRSSAPRSARRRPDPYENPASHRGWMHHNLDCVQFRRFAGRSEVLPVSSTEPSPVKNDKAGEVESSFGAGTRNVHDVIRRLILEGELAAGMEISQLELSRKLSVSRTPLREALRLLEREGLVVDTGPIAR